MISHLELAQISKQIYFRNGGHVVGWQITEYFDDQKGFAVGVYEKPEVNRTVIAFRGTDTGSFKNFINNFSSFLQIATGKKFPLLFQAKEFVQKIRDERREKILHRLWNFLVTRSSNKLYLTGHSLGGFLANFVGYHMLDLNKDYEVVTFESIGIANLVNDRDHMRFAEKFRNNFTTYLVGPNPVNTCRKHLGKIRLLKVKPNSHGNFVSRGYYHYNHAVQCLTHDIFRVIFLLLIVNIFTTLFGVNMLSRKFNTYIDSLSPYLNALEPLKNLNDNNDPVISFWFFLVSLMFLLSYRVAEQTVSTFLHQHRIEVIINELTKGKGEPAEFTEMLQWPTLSQYFQSQGYHLLNWLDPRRHPSIVNIKKPDELYNQRIKETEGYVEAKPNAKQASS